MVQGRVVRPLMMGGRPQQQQQVQENQPHRKLSSSSRRRPSDRRRSLSMHLGHRGSVDDTHDLMSKYSSRRRYDTVSRMKSMFGNSMQKFRHSSLDDEKYQSDSNIDYMESQGRHRVRKNNQHLTTHEIRRPFLVPSFATLPQRADLWIITALSSCVSLASFVSSSNNTLSTTNRRFAFSTSIITFLVSFGLGAAFRYAPFRHSVTRSLSIISPPTHRLESPIIAGIQTAISQSYISIELLLVSTLTLFWIIAIPVIVDGFSGMGQDPLAVFGMEIWNANLFYSSWISAILIGYIWIELLTSSDRYGRVFSSTASSGSATTWKENTFSKRWILLTFSSIVVLSSSSTVYGGNLCDGDILKGTVYCRKALLGIMVGGFVQLVCCSCVGVIYRLRNMDYTGSSYYYDSRGRRRNTSRRHMRKKISVWKREKYSLFFAIISLIAQIVNVAMLTSPTGGGPGNSSGSLYFASWVSFLLVFEMCLRYLELHTTSMGRKVKRKSEKASEHDDTDYSDETDASEEDDYDLPPEQQSTVMRMLRNGSMGSRSSSGAPVYEEVDSLSSPGYAIQPQTAAYRVQPPPPQHHSPPETNIRAVALTTNDGPSRPQIEPEEEFRTSPYSSSRDLSESLRDFSIGSKSTSPDPSGDRQRALPPISTGSVSDDISNDELFREQNSRAQSYVTQESSVSEELDERKRHRDRKRHRKPEQYEVKQVSRHTHDSSSQLSPLNEDSREGRRSSDSQLRSQSGSQRSASLSGSDSSGSRRSGSQRSGSYRSGSQYSSEESQEMEQIPPPPVYRPTKAVRHKSHSIRSKSKSRSRSGSRGESRNASRESLRRNQETYSGSDNDSGEDSPPPTISDSGKSQRSNLSGFSQGSPATQSRSKSTRSGSNNGPPPPPFQRSEVDVNPQYYSDREDHRRPVNSVFTRSGLSSEDSVVSDPTLDAALHNLPVPVPTRRKSVSAGIPRNRSDPSFDKDKSVTSSPGSDGPDKTYRRSSSDELPPSEENVPNGSSGSGDEQVDNIVAAALAYAEKTHSMSSYDPQSKSPAHQSGMAKKRPSGSSKRRRRKSDPELRASRTSNTSSAVDSGVLSAASLHSFYSGDAPSEGKESNGSIPTQPSVQDMVSAALAYAEETRQQQKQKSEKSQASSAKNLSKSVGSMFSDSEAYSEADERSEFDC